MRGDGRGRGAAVFADWGPEVEAIGGLRSWLWVQCLWVSGVPADVPSKSRSEAGSWPAQAAWRLAATFPLNESSRFMEFLGDMYGSTVAASKCSSPILQTEKRVNELATAARQGSGQHLK